ncbi:MAG: hypothetical protein KME52_27965 [Desmonostoc geniculatum HA4340-LM1]|jgi:hypothetical protein|nr:hypothetical protein [Desmonostoc geniculatum HA4340-LM1]
MLINFILAISITGQIIIAQRKPEHDTIPRLTQEQQEEINLTIADCQKRQETIDLACDLTYQELVDWVKGWEPARYDRPNLCDRFERLKTPWTQQEHIEYSRLKCSIGD